jgi:hypothetical protein
MVALVVSDITPATSLLVIAPVVIALTGTEISSRVVDQIP